MSNSYYKHLQYIIKIHIKYVCNNCTLYYEWLKMLLLSIGLDIYYGAKFMK